MNDAVLLQREHYRRSVHVLNTVHAGKNPYRTASHIALLGIK